MEQLRTLGRQIDVPVFSEPGDPVQTAAKGLAEARRLGRDVLIVDTAGRLAIDAEMMEQVRQISAVVQPNYTFLVLDAMTGQDAVGVAEAFHETLAIDGVILSKLDGDARGGAALSASKRSSGGRSRSPPRGRSSTPSSSSTLIAWPAGSSAWATCSP